MNPALITYGALGVAIASEVIATSLLPLTREFTRPVPTAAALLLYAVSFYLLTIAIRTLPIGIAYAFWCGLGIVLVAGLNYFVRGQSLDLPALLGLSLILSGVIVINLFSASVPH